jgi:hypothetical protein
MVYVVYEDLSEVISTKEFTNDLPSKDGGLTS